MIQITNNLIINDLTIIGCSILSFVINIVNIFNKKNFSWYQSIKKSKKYN